MPYEINTLAGFLQTHGEDCSIDRGDVAPRVLAMTVWQGMVSLSGGYLPHATYVCRSKAGALDFLIDHAEHGSDTPRKGMRAFKAELRRGHVARREGNTYELVQMTVGELF